MHFTPPLPCPSLTLLGGRTPCSPSFLLVLPPSLERLSIVSVSVSLGHVANNEQMRWG